MIQSKAMQEPLFISTVGQTHPSADTSCYFPCNKYKCFNTD